MYLLMHSIKIDYVITCYVTDVTDFRGVTYMNMHGFVARWITRLTTDQKIPGSNPGKLIMWWTGLPSW